MREQSKAAVRRKKDPRFGNLWFVGLGIDVGCGNDPISKEDWPNVTTVDPWDAQLGQGDGQYMDGVHADTYDFVHASHSLEHMRDPRVALLHWTRILKPGGHIVCTVPDEVLYESGVWPSRLNRDHKSSFTLRATPTIMGSHNVAVLIWKMVVLDIEKLELIRDGWRHDLIGQDQSLGDAECAIEFVVRKQRINKPW